MRTSPQLEKLLRESVQECRQREAGAYDALTEGLSGAPLVLFGAGGLGRVLARVAQTNGDTVAAFADNAERLWGSSIDGVPVLSPMDAAARFSSSGVFIVTIWSAFTPGTMVDRIRELHTLGCRHVVPFHLYLWKYHDNLPYFNVDLPSAVLEQRDAVLACMDLWADDRSRADYIAQVRARLFADFEAIPPREVGREYFPEDLVSLGEDSVFVDVGGFDGDSLESFIQVTSEKFKQAIVYEPDPANFEKLQARLSGPLSAFRSRISARQQAVSDSPGVIPFLAGQGMSSRSGADGGPVQAVTLDSLLDEGITPTYIKMDVEGYEPETLEGASRIIRECVPGLAVCVYHKQDHLWSLPLAIRARNAAYRFYLRSYGFIWDEVCYAIPR